MIETVEKKKELYQIFNYIKDVYLKIFSSFLDEKTIDRIKAYDENTIKVDEIEEYGVRVYDDLEFRMNIEEFIKNNNLNIENNKDIGEEQIKKIEYLLNNKDNPYKVVKEDLLENSIILFIKAKTCIEIGVASYITNLISNKCNIKANINYVKELNLVNEIINVVGEKNFFENVLSNKIDNLADIYNQYDLGINNENRFQNIVIEANKVFESYYKNKNKVYYADSLYYYSKIDYTPVINKIEKVFTYKDKINKNMQLRILSIRECIKELDRYKIILNEEEKQELYYASINIEGIFSKNDTIIKKYNRSLEYEQKIKPIVEKIWNYYINYEGEYSPNEEYCFLIENYEYINNDKIKKVNLITNDNILVSDVESRHQYGFIYKIKNNAIIYASPDKIIYTKGNNEYQNINSILVNGEHIEIEDQIYSNLMTPRMLLLKTIEGKYNYNNVLLNSNYIYKAGVYCITNDEQNDINYKKAVDLASKYELPIIPLIKK